MYFVLYLVPICRPTFKYFSKEEEDFKSKAKLIGEKIKVIEFRNNFQNLEGLAVSIISVSLFLASLFFASMSFTGNVIGNITEDYSRIIGLCLFVCGLIFSFICIKKRK